MHPVDQTGEPSWPAQVGGQPGHDASRVEVGGTRSWQAETPGSTDCFFAATPIREIAELHIGSRPASRPKDGRATRAIEDLRAIPWSFSWGQCRVALPGWYGFGSAVQAFLAQGDRDAQLALLRRYRQRHAGDPAVERLKRGIHLSINGIAAGLRNTGRGGAQSCLSA